MKSNAQNVRLGCLEKFQFKNQKDFNDFMKKYENNDLIKGISFYAVSSIQEAIDLIIEK